MGRRGFRLRSGRGGWFGSCGDPGLEWPETQACLESAGASACGIFRALQKNLPPAAIALAPFLKQKNVKEQGPTPLRPSRHVPPRRHKQKIPAPQGRRLAPRAAHSYGAGIPRWTCPINVGFLPGAAGFQWPGYGASPTPGHRSLLIGGRPAAADQAHLFF